MTENECIKSLNGIYPEWCSEKEEYEMAQVAIQALEEIQAYRAIGTVEEFKALKTENAELHNEAQAEFALLDKRDAEVRAKAIDEFANFIHKKAKQNNGLRLSSETRSWTHASIFDYVNEFRTEQLKEGAE